MHKLCSSDQTETTYIRRYQTNIKYLNCKLTIFFSVSVDEALNKSIGTIGRWQFRISFLMSLLKFPIAWFQLGIVFLAPPTSFWCRRPPEYVNTTVDEWLRMITPNYTESYNRVSSLLPFLHRCSFGCL